MSGSEMPIVKGACLLFRASADYDRGEFTFFLSEPDAEEKTPIL